MRLYLAGRMRGLIDNGAYNFEYWAEVLREKGHEVFSPYEESVKLFGPGGEYNKDRPGDAMKRGRVVFAMDLAYITTHADMVATIPGWEANGLKPASTGTTAEVATAIAIGIPVLDVREF